MAKKGGRQTCFGIIEQVKSSAKREEGALDFLSFIFFVFLGPHPWHMEVPTLEAESELLPLAYTTATATPDLSHVFDLHHSSWPRWILHPLSEARNRTRILMDPRQGLNPLSHHRNSRELGFPKPSSGFSHGAFIISVTLFLFVSAALRGWQHHFAVCWFSNSPCFPSSAYHEAHTIIAFPRSKNLNYILFCRLHDTPMRSLKTPGDVWKPDLRTAFWQRVRQGSRS